MCTGLVLGIILLGWCEPQAVAAQQGGATFCQVAKPITWSTTDTRITKEQVDEHNAVGKARCGWGKKVAQ